MNIVYWKMLPIDKLQLPISVHELKKNICITNQQEWIILYLYGNYINDNKYAMIARSLVVWYKST